MRLPDPQEWDFLAYAVRQDPYSLLRRATEETIAGLASDLELALALHAEVQAGRATASSSQAVPEVSDRIARAQMREDKAEARSRMVCWP